MDKKEYWFKLTKWSTNKPDFCRIFANNDKEAIREISDQLWQSRHLKCEYFSTSGKYLRNIDDIMNFEIVPFKEVQKHIDKINFAIRKQEEEVSL